MTNYAALANMASGLLQAGQGLATNSGARSQAQIAEREAEERGRLHDQEVRAFVANQEVAFLKSGVELEGSPLIILKDTISKGFSQSESIRRAGANQAGGILTSGRNALLSGALSGALTLAKVASGPKKTDPTPVEGKK